MAHFYPEKLSRKLLKSFSILTNHSLGIINLLREMVPGKI